MNPNQKPVAGRKARILIVDDHPITREGLANLIRQTSDLTVCGEAADAEHSIAMIVETKPDLVVLDISLPGRSGIELLKDLHAMDPHLPILVISMHDESLYAERALRAGARGYVMKQEQTDVILAAIRRVLAGELSLSNRVKEKMLNRLAQGGKDATAFSMDTLSDREMEVFQLIGNGFGTRQIAERLNLSVKTIDSYREHLKVKLQLAKGADLVHHAIQWVKSEHIM